MKVDYAVKVDLKNAEGVDTPTFAQNVDLTILKPDVDKLVPVPFDLSKLSDKVKNDVFNIYIYIYIYIYIR